MEKAEIRKQILKARHDLTAEDCLSKSRKIHERILSIQPYLKSRIIMTYVSFGQEVDTQNLIPRFLNDDKKVCAPRIQNRALESIKITGLSDLAPGIHGLKILEPKPQLQTVISIDEILFRWFKSWFLNCRL